MGQCAQKENSKCLRCGYVSTKNNSKVNPALPGSHICRIPSPVISESSEQKTPSKNLLELRKTSKKLTSTLLTPIPTNPSHIHFTQSSTPCLSYPPQFFNLPASSIKSCNFQQKLLWFRHQISLEKQENRHGFQKICVDRQNLIASSYKALVGKNLFKELKIQFMQESAEDAGGGVLRQWMHLCVKEIMDGKIGLMKMANTDEGCYQFLWRKEERLGEEKEMAIGLLGMIMAKALIQNIPLNCPLDFSILRQLCFQPVHLSDVYSYDKAFYNSWSSILKMSSSQLSQLCLTGTVLHTFSQSSSQTPQSQLFELFPNGSKTQITSQSKSLYISSLISLYCTKSIQSQLQLLSSSLSQSLSPQLLNIWQPWQFSMVLTGGMKIDVQDLKENTVYDGFLEEGEGEDEEKREERRKKRESGERNRKWFWEILGACGQKELGNLLVFVTGGRRVPVGGFAKLQSSYGHIKKFTIRRVDYDSSNPYPKSYTCFNRLDLPDYPSKEQMKQRLQFILKQQFTYFGLC